MFHREGRRPRGIRAQRHSSVRPRAGLAAPLATPARVLAAAFAAGLGIAGFGCDRPPSSTRTLTPASDGAGAASSSSGLETDSAPLLAPADAGEAPGKAVQIANYGEAKTAPKVLCAELASPRAKNHLAELDLRTSFVDGDDLLALVNRSPTGVLSPDFAPSDLIDLATGKPVSSPKQCDLTQCLRKDAAASIKELFGAMKREGFPAHIESAYRSYSAQCVTFLKWSRHSNFCQATEQSALPGHSQHQLGTTADVFSDAWAQDPRGSFRDGFGCTKAGQWLREHGWEYGWVFPYPIHPDDKNARDACHPRTDVPVPINPLTGYRYEHWHARFIGKDNARAFVTAAKAKNALDPDAYTLEQWLREQHGLGPTESEIPVCDGCSCGACATMAAPGTGVCGERALHLDEHGAPRAGEASALGSTKLRREGDLVVLEAEVNIGKGAITQPPLLDVAPLSNRFDERESFTSFTPFGRATAHAYPSAANAVRIGLEPRTSNPTGPRYPYRVGLADAKYAFYNRANVLLPAAPGASTVVLRAKSAGSQFRVALLNGETAVAEKEVSVDGMAGP